MSPAKHASEEVLHIDRDRPIALTARLSNPPKGRRSVPTPRGGTGTIRSGNDSERPGTTPAGGELFEPLGSFLERTKNLPAPSWLVPELVPDSGRLFVVAAPNAGKTFLALVLAKAASAVARPVYLVLEEGGARAIGARFRNLGFDSTASVSVAHLRGVALGDDTARAQLAAVLRDNEAPVLVLDPFASIFLGDENDTREMNQAKEHLEELARVNPRALLVLCHHTSKAGERGDGGAGMYAARGSSILSAWADVQLNLKHEPVAKDSGRVAFVAKVEKNRDGERGRQTRVTVTLGDADTATVTLEEAGEAADNGRTARIVEVAADSPGLSRDALAKRAGGHKARTLALIDQLAHEGALEKSSNGYRTKNTPTNEVNP